MLPYPPVITLALCFDFFWISQIELGQYIRLRVLKPFLGAVLALCTSLSAVSCVS